MPYYAKHVMVTFIDKLLESEESKKLINSDAKFDVIVAEAHHPMAYALGEKFKAPVVGVLSCSAPLDIYDMYGNPTHPLISPDYSMPVESSPMDHPFWVRVQAFLFNIWYRVLNYWIVLPKSNKLLKKHFGENFPSMEDIMQRYSSILLNNVNIVANPVRANVPSVIEINQIHIRENRTLPKDLQEFLDSSVNGAIFFSLGATVPCSSLKNGTIYEIIQAFAKLPFNVLWKFEEDGLLNLPPNVQVRKFFPQQDLLAHPNIKVFVTQGGMQSIEESIFKGVPMVGIPLISEQPMNVNGIVRLGVAVKVNPTDITKDSLAEAIMEVATNSSYKSQVEKLKSILEDQPMRGLDKAIWWIEYVIRHKGAEHLRSSAADMPLIRYFMLDVIFVLLLMIYLIFYIFYNIVKFARQFLNGKLKKE